MANEELNAKEHQTSLKTAGQRRVNLLWESTQALVALAVTGATLYISAVLALSDHGATAFVLLSNAFFVVIGFYFGRTNGTRTGGISGSGDRYDDAR